MLVWILILAILGFLLYTGRSYVQRFVRFIWEDGARLLCCSLVALAVVATALNSIGIHPLSVPGTMLMGLVGCVIGAIFLRWGETRP